MTKLQFLSIIGVLLLCATEGDACKSICGSEGGIGENLRPHFTSCMKEKAGARVNWEYLVNYVVWDDIWYLATDKFYCRNKGSDCWLKQATYFLKKTSKYLKPFQECIVEYSPEPGTDTNATETNPYACDQAENPVYIPLISKRFSTLKKCPLSKYKYISCLVSGALAVTRNVRISSGKQPFLPKYNFVELSRFIMDERSDCRITQVRGSSSYITRCAANPKPSASPVTTATTAKPKPKGVIISKRSITLEELMKQLQGGRLNFRISSSGTARILPSGPLVPTITTAYKCLGLKLQTILRPRSILSSVASKCNHDILSKPPVTHRVSTSFRVASKPIKLPGMVGECGENDEWTKWYDIDKPDKTGDLEYFSWIRNRNSRDVCFAPSAVQALVADTLKPYTDARQNVRVTPRLGLSCYNYAQAKGKKCENYTVRFCCPKL